MNLVWGMGYVKHQYAFRSLFTFLLWNRSETRTL